MEESELNTLAHKVASIILERIGLVTLANANAPHPAQPQNWVTAKKMRELTGLSTACLYRLREKHPEIQKKMPKRHAHQQRQGVLWDMNLIQNIILEANEQL